MTEILGSLLLQVAVLAAAILAATYIYIRSTYSYWTELGIPVCNPVVPFGNFADAALKNVGLQALISKYYKAFEGHKLGGLYGFTSKFLLVRDPELIRDILVKDFDHFHDRGTTMVEDAHPLLGNLFSMSGSKWRKLRVKLTPTFTSGKMRMMLGTLVDCSKELNSVLREPARNGETFEVKEVLARFTTDVIASCAFGIECNCLKNPDAEFRLWGRRIFSATFRMRIFRFANLLLPSLIRFFGFSFIPTDVSSYFMKMVVETVEFREKNGVHRNDFMQLLIQLKNKTLTAPDEHAPLYGGGVEYEPDTTDSKALEVTMEVIAAQAFVFFIAGFETSSTTMTFCLYELAMNQGIQDRLRAEIDRVLQKHGGHVSYEAVSEMGYLGKVVNETLRKYPALQILLRECTKPYRIAGTDVTLEKGIRVFIPVMGLHYDPKYYPDPQRFDPERSRQPYVYLPFGEGPRTCIGMRFGLMQTKVGLVSILSSYELHVSERTPVPIVLDPRSFITSPSGGMHLKITERSDNR